MVVFGTEKGALVGLEVSRELGYVAWERKLAKKSLIGLPVINDDKIYVADSAGGIYATNQKGRLEDKWMAGEASITGIAVDRERVYAATRTGGVVGFSE